MKIFNGLLFNAAKTLVFAMILGLYCQPVRAQDPVDIVVEYEKGSLHDVNAQYEHKGVVIVNSPVQDEVAKSLPLEVSAKLDFAQRSTENPGALQAIRYYRKSKAKIQIDNNTTESKLADENRLVVVRLQSDSAQRLQLASISDAFKQAELDLVRNPADPLAFPNMFTRKNIRLGDKWKASSEAVADFLAVDQVYENDLVLLFKDFDKGIAKIYLAGSVKAEVDDVTTEIELNGIALIDVTNQQLTALRATINENRRPGQVAPGFDGQTKIDVKMTPRTSIPELSNDALAKLNSKQVERRIKWESTAAEFQISYDPRWRIIASEVDAAILRYVDRGDLLAQCNIVELPARPADNPLPMEQFKTELTKIIEAEASAKIVDSEVLKTSTGLTALRVVVEGVEEKVPVQWIYYHVEANDGRRLTFVFTLEQEIADRFASADKKLVNETIFKPKSEKAGSSERAAFKRSNSDDVDR